MNEYLKKRQQLIFDGRPLKTKDKKPIAKVSEKRKQKLAEQKEAGSDNSLDKWFDEIEERHWGKFGGKHKCCMECGELIPKQYARHAIAHLLPKKIFHSVSTHPLNYLILGAGCGCHDRTHTISKFIKMKCWPEAKERILQMMPLLPTDELRRISNQLLIALDMTEK